MEKLMNNIEVYGIDESIKASKYPMSTNISLLNSDVTDTVKSLGAAPAGSGHDNFLNGIIVQFDLTFSLKAWTEMQRYHFIDFVSSQSTMHRICKFDIGKQCNEYVVPSIVTVVDELVRNYNDNPNPENYLKVLYNVPVGFRLTARMTTNYRQLKTIYNQRLTHRIPGAPFVNSLKSYHYLWTCVLINLFECPLSQITKNLLKICTIFFHKNY